MLSSLDKNLLCVICNSLDDYDLLTLQLTCKDLYFGINRDSFWMNRIIKRFQNLVPTEGLENYKEIYMKLIERIDHTALKAPGYRITSVSHETFDMKIVENNLKLDDAFFAALILGEYGTASKIIRENPVLLNPNIIFLIQNTDRMIEFLMKIEDRRIKLSSYFGKLKLSRMSKEDISKLILSTTNMDLSEIIVSILTGDIKEFDREYADLISKEDILRGINKIGKSHTVYFAAEFEFYLHLYLEKGGNINLVKTKDRGSPQSEFWNKTLFLIKSKFLESIY